MDYGTSTTLDASLTFVEGRQWAGIPAVAVTVGGVVPTPDISSISMRFCGTGEDSTANLTLVSPTNITITDANGWTFTVLADINGLALDVGTYRWFLDITDTDNVVWPLLKGYQIVDSKGGV